MRSRDFLILMLCCAIWAANFVVSAWTLGKNPVPPFMLGTLRALFVLLLLGWILFKPRPPKFFRLLLVCAFVGPLHLGFLYSGLQFAPASASAVISQLLIPFATILSVLFLKEQIGYVRGLGIAGAFLGTLIMVYEPGSLRFDLGLLCIVSAYLCMAIGSVLMKTVGEIDWKEYIVWMAVLMVVCMGLISFVFEKNHAEVWQTSKWPLLIAAAYAGSFVSIIAHGQYFRLIQTYDVTRIVPLTLIVPFFAAVLGIVFLDETLSRRMLFGAVFILPCVFIIAKRQRPNTSDLESYHEPLSK